MVETIQPISEDDTENQPEHDDNGKEILEQYRDELEIKIKTNYENGERQRSEQN